MSSNKYSYSKLECYKNCPYSFKLRYELGNYFYSDNVATVFGTNLHEREEYIFNCIRNNQPIDYVKAKNDFIVNCAKIEQKFTKDFNSPTKSGKTYKQEMYDFLDKGIYLLERFHNEHPEYEFLDAEKEFNYNYKGILFHGFIDRVFRNKNDNTIYVEDIKSWNAPLANNDEKLKLSLQAVVYALSVKDIYGAEPAEVTFSYDLPLLGIKQNTRTGKDFIKDGMAELDNIFKEISEKDFHASPSPLCHWCAFSKTNPNATPNQWLCPYFSHWTKDKKDFSVENKWQGEEKDKDIVSLYYKMYNIKRGK